MKKKSSFVWVAQGNESYGVVSAMLNLASEVRRNGHSVRFVVFETGGLSDALEAKDFSYDLLEVGSALSIRRASICSAIVSCTKNALRMLRISIALVSYLKASKPDYFHIVPNVLVLPGAVAARFARVNVIFEMSNALSDAYPFDFNRRLYQWACRLSNCLVLANSTYSGTTIAGRGVEPVIFHLGVDVERFKLDRVSNMCRESLGLHEDDFVIGLIARFSIEKGQLTLVQALKQAREVNSDLNVLLVGGPGSESYMAEVHDYVIANQLADSVVFSGSQENVQDYYDLVDITVNLRPDPEPFGLSVVESMLMQKPVLVHALGGPAETVLNNVTGWHMEALEVSKVAEQLIEICDNKDALKTMGKQARVHAEVNFSLESQYQRYTDSIDRYFQHG